jgi:hypothetical protein
MEQVPAPPLASLRPPTQTGRRAQYEEGRHMTLRIARSLLLVLLLIPSSAFARSGSAGNDGPRQGVTVTVTAVDGVSTVRAPGSPPARLSGKQIVPVGSRVDATQGTVSVHYQCARCPAGVRIKSGVFSGGRFVVDQGHGSAVPTLTMDGSLRRCAGAGAGDGTRRLARHLEGRVGKARFDVVGRYASVHAGRARWLVADYCTRTFVAAARGTVDVIDRQTDRSTAVSPLTAISILRPTRDGEAVGGGCCATALPWAGVSQNTAVEMEDGSSLGVDTVQIGEEVRSGNPLGAAAEVFYTGSAHVRDARMINLTTDGGRSLMTGPATPVWTPDGPVRAEELVPGGQVLMDGATATVASVEAASYDGMVVALGLEGAQAYVANGFIVGSLTS